MPLSDNLVEETSTSTGTGGFALTDVTGRQAFDETFPTGTGGVDVFWYGIANRDADEWEVGSGAHISGTLRRQTIIASSNSGGRVSFSAGTKDVTSDIPFSEQYYTGISGITVGTDGVKFAEGQFKAPAGKLEASGATGGYSFDNDIYLASEGALRSGVDWSMAYATDGTKTLTGSVRHGLVNDGTATNGAFNVSDIGGNMRTFVNGGSTTNLVPQANNSVVILFMENSATPGTVTATGDYDVVRGDLFTTATGDDFILTSTVINGRSALVVQDATN